MKIPKIAKKFRCKTVGHRTSCYQEYLVNDEAVQELHTHTCLFCGKVLKYELLPVEQEYSELLIQTVKDLNLKDTGINTVVFNEDGKKRPLVN